MKIELGSNNLYYPTLTVLVGANVNEKPNFETIAWGGVMGMDLIYIASNKSHYTNRGIRDNKTFSINIPSVDIVEETDYCGLHSGIRTDKSCIFKTFYGKLKNAPMITECPVNMECELVETFRINGHEIFTGKIIQTYCDEKCMTKGVADLSKIQPFFFSFIDTTYWSLGKQLEKAMSTGKNYKR
jgi:flavin reductase (DIM6/NTAB) family NADH-FMN oxidoreductase RutF